MNSPKLLTTLALLPFACSLHAQDERAPSTPDDAPNQVFEIDDFVVTGQKLGRTLQETQTSVSFYSASALKNTPTVSLTDVFKMTANTYAYDGGFSIRGITNMGLTNSEGSEMATVLLDGARVDAQMLSFDGLTMWDIEQVEILRGPQSTSQGRNSLAGAVVITTKQPTFDWDADARATYGELDNYQLAAAAGGPLVEDVLAFRASIDRQYSDGSIENLTRDEDDWARTDNLTFRGKLLFAPKAWNGFTATLMYQQTDSENGERAYSYGSNWDEIMEREAIEDTRNEFESRSRIASLVLEQPLFDQWRLTATTAWSDFKSSSAYDGDRTPSGPGQDSLIYGYGYDNENLSQELRLLGRGESWRIMGGVYAAYEDQSTHSLGPFYYTLPSAYAPLFGLPTPARVLLDNDTNYGVETRSYAAFVNGDWDLSEKWTISAGLRVDYEEKDRSSFQDISLLEGYPDAVALVDVPSLGIPAGTPADILIAGLAAQASAQGQGTEEFTTALPSLGVTYHWTDKISTGFTYSQGYRSGGVSFNQSKARTVEFDPEYTNNFELSFRSQWLDDRLTFNANAFYAKWKDQQVDRQFSDDVYDSNVVNASDSHYYGFEVELREYLQNGWSLYQNVGYTKTQFDDFSDGFEGGDSFDGNEFPWSPKWTLGTGVSYQHDSGWFGNTSLTYIDNAFANIDNADDFRLGERLLLDAKIGYRADHWSVYLYGTNLLDDDYLERLWADANNPGTGYGAVVGSPRIVGIGFEANY